MRYLITYPLGQFEPFTTDVFDFENNYSDGMVVYDLSRNRYTKNGLNWRKLNEDQF